MFLYLAIHYLKWLILIMATLAFLSLLILSIIINYEVLLNKNFKNILLRNIYNVYDIKIYIIF
jgi:hypothetical protein